MTLRRPTWRLFTVAAAAAIVLGVLSTLGLAAASSTFYNPPSLATSSWAPRCAAPALTGTVVNVTLTDMRGMMRGPYQPGPMMGGPYQPGPMNGGPYQPRPGANPQWWPSMGMGMMRIFATPGNVPRGTVSILASNAGAWTHELVVLPLLAGQGVGQRPVGSDGKINETGSLGEASRSCDAGSGDGIVAGATGWTTLTLEPGRYELVCNLPGHYASGMYAELDVTT